MGTGTGEGTGRERGRGWRPVNEHRIGTGTETGTEARTVAEMGTGTRITGTGTRIGSGRAEKRRRSAKKPQNSCKRHVGNGGDLGLKRKTCRKERVGLVAANTDNLESNKEVGGEDKVLRAQVRIVQVERACPLCRV